VLLSSPDTNKNLDSEYEYLRLHSSPDTSKNLDSEYEYLRLHSSTATSKNPDVEYKYLYRYRECILFFASVLYVISVLNLEAHSFHLSEYRICEAYFLVLVST